MAAVGWNKYSYSFPGDVYQITMVIRLQSILKDVVSIEKFSRDVNQTTMVIRLRNMSAVRYK